MKLGIYSFFNRALGAFDTKFQLDDHEEKRVVYDILRGFKARCVLGTYQELKYLEFYYLGTFDDETGEFEADKKLLVNFDREIALYENSLKETKEDVDNNK